MLVVETVARIRREFFVKGKSIKEIVPDLSVSRNTVRKVTEERPLRHASALHDLHRRGAIIAVLLEQFYCYLLETYSRL